MSEEERQGFHGHAGVTGPGSTGMAEPEAVGWRPVSHWDWDERAPETEGYDHIVFSLVLSEWTFADRPPDNQLLVQWGPDSEGRHADAWRFGQHLAKVDPRAVIGWRPLAASRATAERSKGETRG